ncbi:Sec1-like protein [Fimicolochytrium jonesii]|uniref:Sec1-like protein n=1 Tax=Fimicolochytrium jonesii TaxID=1396493 RepID=UPI0022FE5120|nr:Sec1-like protein [Fimicolochytrium jonesii]KAI8823539.1 Sec1-like protein [Fimicolochytrium jonesii]
MTSLKEIMKKRILNDMLQSVQPANRWKILVVDSKSVKLLNSACRMHDILEENVTLVEDINKKRQAYPSKEAIYFISPTDACIQRLIDDFPAPPTNVKESKKQEQPQRMYAAGHIFFTSALPDRLFDRIKGSPAISSIRNLKEMNMDFIPYESQVFTFDMAKSALPLYSPLKEGSRQNEITLIAQKLASTLATLGDYPYIRYYASPTSSIPTIPLYLAQAVKSELDTLARQDPSFPPASPYKRSVLVILDRSLDMVSPIVHEFTYQAMMHDLLVLEGGRYVYKPDAGDVSTDVDEPKKEVTATLDENDPIWMLIRHWHYADAVDYIRHTFNKFLTENRAASSAMGKDGAAEATGLDSLKHMKDTLSSLPQFQEMKGKFSVHINICQECRAMFERRQLDLVAAVEQDLATGETADGRAIKFSKMMIDMVPALDSPTVSSVDKLRILMLYIIAQNGIEDEERRRLLGYAKLSLEESQVITNLGYWGVRLGKEKGEKDAKGRYGYHVHGKKRKKGTESEQYDLSRWQPVLKSVLEDQATSQLDPVLFPWLTEPAPEDPTTAPPKTSKITLDHKAALTAPDPQYPHSLRTTRPSWSQKRKPKTAGDSKTTEQSPQATASDIRKNGPRIIVFTVGGVTFSELRTVYSIREAFQRDVLIGSTHVSPPLQWIELLKQMGKVDESGAGSAAAAGSPEAAGTPDVGGGRQDGTLKRSETEQSVHKEKGEKGLLGMFHKKKKDKGEKGESDK